jgi:putative methyltransferase (TIGR04325 family)
VNVSARDLVKSIVPPVLWRLGRQWVGHGLVFSGKPHDWVDACRMSTGYSSDVILQKVAHATREVAAGRAAFERDSILFEEPEFPFPVLAALLRAAALNGGRLDVLDFGGSLGSTYRQCRPFLEGLAHIAWRVIEQPTFVSLGQREFSTVELTFADSIDDIGVPDVVLASSVLQYLERPDDVIGLLSRIGAKHMILDRTSFHGGERDRLCIQRVPKEIYPASYPCWIFARRRILALLDSDWRVLSDFPSSDGAFTTLDGLKFEFRGLLLERRS